MPLVDLATMCPSCMKLNALLNGKCRFCGKMAPEDLPAGVLPPGIVLNGKYLTGLYLGQGGFGVTYRAFDLTENRTVAIKEYYPGVNRWCSRTSGNSRINVTESDDFQYGLKHFRGEPEILRNFSDIPEVVRFFDSFDENNTAYYAMELLHGQTLQQYLSEREKASKPLSYYEAVNLLMPVLLGLEKIHRRGATHRDIKPGNIFICEDGSARIMDFGAAAAEGSQFSDSFMPAITEGYSPPEQNTISHTRGKQGPWSDVYSVACTLYRCVVGKRPIPSSARLAGDKLDFGRVMVSEKQRRILEKNMSLDPKARCSSMIAFGQDLLTGLRGEEAEALQNKYPSLKQKPLEKPGPVIKDEPPTPPPPSDKTAPFSGGVTRTLGPEITEKAKGLGQETAAFCLDLLLFLAFPLVLGKLTGTDLQLMVMLGYMVGVFISTGLTCSRTRGSPGQIIFGLKVMAPEERPPNTQQALLYCMLRLLWPLKPIDLICRATTGTSLIQMLSGCYPVRRAEAEKGEDSGKQLMLRITEGLYAGNLIPLVPGKYVIGRYPDVCNLLFPMEYKVVSRVQGVLFVDDRNGMTFTNKSSHGTSVAGKKLEGEESIRINPEMEIAFGKEKMMITYAEGE